MKNPKPPRKPQEKVNIDGKDYLWGEFEKKFYEDIEAKAN
jgi:hypothetical protein